MPSFPVFIGCTDNKREDDVLYDFDIWYCNDCDVGQQISVPPLEELYKEQRCFGFGTIWENHYQKFSEFIKKHSNSEGIGLEVGVGNAVVFKKLHDFFSKLYGVDYIDNPNYKNFDIKVGVFTEKLFDLESFDVIYSSHVIEHLPDPVDFLNICKKLLKNNGICFVACPNILKSFENLHFNAFTSDHLNYFTKNSLTRIANSLGFELIDYYQYLDHGMYLAFKKTQKHGLRQSTLNQFQNNFANYEERLLNYVQNAKNELRNNSSVYVFGAHGLTVVFLKILNDLELENKIKFVLDNEKTKHDRRLCGTNLTCKSPTIISDEEKPVVLLYMGAYEEEISKQLKKINSNCIILSSKE
ncbi:3-demethylubiquinone-9 3-methyltransferase protein [Marine Group I thaumarchaeote SCGC AAA799-E16]|uniref:3-demethylubiquinone-9 3-methyltransferase protein n=2 Tax=Marine Group I TaxID=905826 RepID=A0A087S249_9ARCH|nr:3-demethylubiquinone-9 3-methyltransferase protein [Marine Group I thaumarchaeote SCGC AAA799-E16]KFM19803.1 3-demethylubiquinone-9 3-methyltransferase protein [Marine Group I thaumarchaeote SCGC RSA3]